MGLVLPLRGAARWSDIGGGLRSGPGRVRPVTVIVRDLTSRVAGFGTVEAVGSRHRLLRCCAGPAPGRVRRSRHRGRPPSDR